MKILFINRSYWPDAEATGQLLTELCEGLADKFEVSVMCGQPIQNPNSESYNKYGKQVKNGVTIIRLPHTQFNKQSFFGRLSNMLTFYASAATRSLFLRKYDIVVTETDPPFLCLVGRMIQFLKRSKLICYLQDIYPDIAIAMGTIKDGTAARVLSSQFKRTYNKAQGIVVLSEDMKSHLEKNVGIDPDKIHVVPNWVDTSLIRPVKSNNDFRNQNECDGKFVVMYSGNLGLTQNIDLMLDAAEHLEEKDQFHFLVIGDGAGRQKIEQRISESPTPNVKLLGYQPKDKLAESLSAADVQIVFLDAKIKQFLMPSKIYGILASGTPVILVTDRDTEIARLVEQNKLGVVLDNESAEDFAAAIVYLSKDKDALAHSGEMAREIAEQKYDKLVVLRQFENLLQGLA